MLKDLLQPDPHKKTFLEKIGVKKAPVGIPTIFDSTGKQVVIMPNTPEAKKLNGSMSLQSLFGDDTPEEF